MWLEVGMSNISLTSSMRSNLLSLQQTAKLQDVTSNRLATGLKVSTAIDNPSSYYTAQSLNSRAEDLSALLNSMGQGIQTIKATTETLESGAKFLEQAKSVANQALEKYQPVVARVGTEAELLSAINSGKKGVIILSNDINVSTNQEIVLQDGQTLAGTNYIDRDGGQAKLTFNVTESGKRGIYMSANSVVSDIKIDLNTTARSAAAIFTLGNATIRNTEINMYAENTIGNQWDAVVGIQAALSSPIITLEGKVGIYEKVANTAAPKSEYVYGVSKGNFHIGQNAQLNVQIAAGIAGYGLVNASLATTGNAVVNVSAYTIASHNMNTSLNDNSVLNLHTTTAYNSSLFSGKTNLNHNAQLNITGGHGLNAATVNINSRDAVLNIDVLQDVFRNAAGPSKITSVAGGKIYANGKTYQTANAITSAVSSVTGAVPPPEFALQAGVTPPAISDIFDKMKESPVETNTEKQQQEQFKSIINQYDSLIKDSGYKGVNLLQLNNLSVSFNETRSSKLNISGVDASSKALGVKEQVWKSQQDVQQSIDDVTSAIEQIRSMSSEFGNYYSIVTNREEFTQNLINVLTEGADKLVLADMNEESANMLALQTRQQLAVNSLSLASQASQSVLKLF